MGFLFGFWGMSYNSIPFLVFFSVFLLFYFIVPKNWMKVTVIILGNLFFYCLVGGLNVLGVVIANTSILYVFSQIINRIYIRGEMTKPNNLSKMEEVSYWKEYKKKTILPCTIGVILTIAVLIYTKVGKICGWTVVSSLSQLSYGKILVPLGLSYYTFSSVGYLIEAYKRKIKFTNNFFLLFASVTFFPIIVEGPISNYDKLIAQFKAIPKFDYDRFCNGLQRMLWGLLKKMVISDRVSLYTSVVFGDVFRYAGAEIVAAAILNVIQIYTDFSGCMDIVIGASESMGISLEENFRSPLLSTSVTDFWRRWHITLFEWFRNYIYMPIVQSKLFKRLNKRCRNRFGNHLGQSIALMVPSFAVWLITGLWHSTGNDYIVWGMYWAVLTTMSNILTPVFQWINKRCSFRTESFGWKLFQVIRTDFFYLVSGLIVVNGAKQGLHGFLYLFQQITVEFRIWKLFNGEIYTYGFTQTDAEIVFLGMLVVFIVDYINCKGSRVRNLIAEQPILFRWMIWVVLIVTIVVLGEYGPGYSSAEFIYKGF